MFTSQYPNSILTSVGKDNVFYWMSIVKMRLFTYFSAIIDWMEIFIRNILLVVIRIQYVIIEEHIFVLYSACRLLWIQSWILQQVLIFRQIPLAGTWRHADYNYQHHLEYPSKQQSYARFHSRRRMAS